MERRSYKNIGRFILAFSIIYSIFMAFISFRNGDFKENLSNGSLFSTLIFSLTCIVLILSGLRMKIKYPDYYLYQVIGAIILLLMVLIVDVIPRVIYLI
ncbi:hypothetical protein [Clostridium intestinale]|uniref:Uncharacterized protein n=1 Tax=Clostridium intestinale DSM 6191 TaxID=1121320 RepID=A0A1M6CXF5_9CLOT|nr:hypothetical protein [Clostridium intestinale]SHI65553.1 hypothetical protein SAMN02745941_04144 [Clostridium intestinale DSM 6191]